MTTLSERQMNERRNWKAETFPYDYFIPDDTQECQYCLTEKQAELLRGILQPVGWYQRWWSDTDTPIDTDAIQSFRDDLIRRLMMSCCDDLIFRYTEDGILQSSDDNGDNWMDDPSDDIRINPKITFPPVTSDLGVDPKCIAADGMVKILKEQIGDQLTDDMSRYTLSQLISDWTTTLIGTSNPFEALVTIAANQIFALVIATLRAAIDDSVYDTLRCIFDCNMEDDGSFTGDEWVTVRSQILSQISGIAGIFFEHLVYLLGNAGLTNLARSSAGDSDADCSACCPDCSTDWDVMDGTHGTITSRGDEYLIIEAQNIGGNYYAIISTNDAALCCVIVDTVVESGATPSLISWSTCGYTPVIGAPQFTGGLFPYGSGCVDYFQAQDSSPFTLRVNFATC